MMAFKQPGLRRVKSISLTALVFLSAFLFLNLTILPIPTVKATAYGVSSDASSGAGTLRQAILDSNAGGSSNTITFSAGPHTITLTSPLPAITQPVVIDGSANVNGNGNPTIEIIGTSAGASADGLIFMASNITLKSLIINRFGGNGVNIQGPGSNNNIISNSFIGTGTTGNAAQANSTGIKIQSSSNNIIGGTTPGTRNIISGNSVNGIWILGPNASGNFVYGNYIGIGLGGAAVPNSDGVCLEGATTSRIGTNTTTNARNIISGNTNNGVLLTGSTTSNNQVMGNYIGTNIAGNAGVPNTYGVQVLAVPTNTIGGSISGMGNLISGNSSSGILLKNSGTTGNLVEGNFIGTDATGSLPLHNLNGISIDNAPGNTIGGSTVLRRNIISGNLSSGVLVEGSGAMANKILGNYIGTDVGGSLPIPNENGVLLNIAGSNIIGDIGGADGNVISGNFLGISILAVGADNNQIRHNLIGVNKDGTAALPNSIGISITGGANSNIIGGTINPPGNRNIISGNTLVGIGISVNNHVPTDNLIQGNYIGLSLSGLVGIPNGYGILLTRASGTIIGKADAGVLNNYRNYITSNINTGLKITESSTVTNESIGNMFGYKGDDTLYSGGGKSLEVFDGGRLKLTGRNRVA